MRKVIIVLLVVLNVGLLIGISTSVLHLPQACAQSLGLSGNFVMLSGRVLGNSADVTYLIDLETRQLLAYYYDKPKNEVGIIGTRDLTRDLSLEQPTGRARPRGR
jgi:hypothetical protein